MKFEIEYISQAGRHVGTEVEDAKDESDAINQLYNGSDDDPLEVLSVEELP